MTPEVWRSCSPCLGSQVFMYAALMTLPQDHICECFRLKLCSVTHRWLTVCVSREISFLIQWAYRDEDDDDGCEDIENFDEGIELSLRRPGDLLWRPVAFFAKDNSRDDNKENSIRLISGETDEGSFKIRGYVVPRVMKNTSAIQHRMQFRLCDIGTLGSYIQFRWLQTMRKDTNEFTRDLWSLDEVQVAVSHDTQCSNVTVFEDDFEEQIVK